MKRLVRSPEQSSSQTTTPPLRSIVAPTLLITPPTGQPVMRMRLAPALMGLPAVAASARRCKQRRSRLST